MTALAMRPLTGIALLLLTPVTALAAAAEGSGSAAEGAVDLVNQPIGMGQLFQTFFSLFLVVMLIIGLAWMVRRSGRFGSALGGQLRAVGGLSLGARERILLVDAGGTHLLVGISPGGGIQTLHVFPEPLDLDGDSEGGEPLFAVSLQKIINRRGGGEATPGRSQTPPATEREG